jgi:hypothetical protein
MFPSSALSQIDSNETAGVKTFKSSSFKLQAVGNLPSKRRFAEDRKMGPKVRESQRIRDMEEITCIKFARAGVPSAGGGPLP